MGGQGRVVRVRGDLDAYSTPGRLPDKHDGVQVEGRILLASLGLERVGDLHLRVWERFVRPPRASAMMLRASTANVHPWRVRMQRG